MGSLRFEGSDFTFWEKHPAPGLVVKLSATLRAGKYHDELWKEITGKTVDELWVEFVETLKV